MKRYQRRTIKSPCCNKKTHIRFRYGTLVFGAFCDCGKPFYLRFRKVRSHRKDMEYIDGHFKTIKYRAGRLMMKTDSNNEIHMPVKKKNKRRKKK